MTLLNWHRVSPGVSRAWAPLLNPDDTFPPYYEIRQLSPRFPVRSIALVQCQSCGGQRNSIGTVRDLQAAKTYANIDYQERLAWQSLTIPS